MCTSKQNTIFPFLYYYIILIWHILHPVCGGDFTFYLYLPLIGMVTFCIVIFPLIGAGCNTRP